MSDLIDRQAAIVEIAKQEKIVPYYFHGEIPSEAYFNAGLHAAMGIIQSQPTASPWHRVKDELPPPNKTVLVCKIWGDVNGEPHKVITMDSFTISPSDSVIAWMPLPEPPKEITNE